MGRRPVRKAKPKAKAKPKRVIIHRKPKAKPQPHPLRHTHRSKPMARKPTPSTAPENDTDMLSEPHEQDQEPAPEQQAEVAPMATQVQVDTHKQNVIAATSTKQGSIAAAYTTFAGDKNNPNLIANIKNADIAYHQAIITSALANGQPYPSGSAAVLRGFGVAA
jgi:hypothetical protein